MGLCATLVALGAVTSAQDVGKDARGLEELLKLPAAPVGWQSFLLRPDAPREHTPAADAPIEVLTDYWMNAASGELLDPIVYPRLLERPDPAVPPRLLAWCELHPEDATKLIRWFPTDDPEFHRRLKALFDERVKGPNLRREIDALQEIYEWLIGHSPYFRKELKAATAEHSAKPKSELFERYLIPLFRLERPAAEKLLLKMAESRDDLRRTAALAWLRKYRLPGDPRLPRWEDLLRKVATDAAATPRARDFAVVELMREPWAGNEAWFLGLFHDPALGMRRGENGSLRPLAAVVKSDPDYWVSRVAPLVGSSDRVVHNNAVRCLANIVDEGMAGDEARRLLAPWQNNPSWADTGDDSDRSVVVSALEGEQLRSRFPIPPPDEPFTIATNLTSGAYDAYWLAGLFARRRELAPMVMAIPDLQGIARGIQVAFTNDDASYREILRGEDVGAQGALLACGAHLRLPLPIEEVARLLNSKDARVVRAARHYLICDDSPAARAAILSQHRGEAMILGWMEGYTFDPVEEDSIGPIWLASKSRILRDMILDKDGPREIITLLRGSNSETALLVYPDRIELSQWDGGGRSRERIVSQAEYDRLDAWLRESRVDELPCYDAGASDGSHYEYIRLTRDGGRRVSMNNPYLAWPGTLYGRIVQQFDALLKAPLTLSYGSMEKLPGFRVVHASEQGAVHEMALERGKAVVRIKTEGTLSEYRAITRAGVGKAEVPTPAIFAEQKNPLDRKPARWEWPAGKMIAVRKGPKAGNSVWTGVRLSDRKEGIWIGSERKSELLAEGKFGGLIVNPDGSWLVTDKVLGTNWAGPIGVVRIRLKNEAISAVDFPSTERLQPRCWLEAQQRVLMQASYIGVSERGTVRPEFHLLDPTSGALVPVEGEFQPILDSLRQPLQPTGKPFEFWATRREPKVLTTVVGRYDMKAFRFTPLLTIPGAEFESREMWVDEGRKVVMFVHQRDLLEVALP